MSAKYLIRLDDACPTFTLDKWQRFFDIFDKYNVKPIIAVIPSNEDRQLFKEKREISEFWKMVKEWEKKGWCIALHGYDHVYINKQSGILKITPHSEFVGLSLEEQTKRIHNGLEIFVNNGVKKPEVFVAPSHSIDCNTILALKQNDVNIISDGIAKHPFVKHGIKWVPCQLWFPKIQRGGVWTICYHPETAMDSSLINLEGFIKQNQNHIVTVDNLTYSKINITDKLYEFTFYLKRNKIILKSFAVLSKILNH